MKKRTAPVRFYLTKEEKEQLKKEAKRLNFATLAGYIRMIITYRKKLIFES